jgi:hypothetical protein
MAEATLFVGWGAVIPGRERQAVEVFGQTLQYYDRLRQEGVISGFDPCLLEPHGGDLDGFIVIRGDRDRLNQLRYSPEFVHNLNRAQLVVQTVGVVMGYVGEELNRLMADFQSNIDELTH